MKQWKTVLYLPLVRTNFPSLEDFPVYGIWNMDTQRCTNFKNTTLKQNSNSQQVRPGDYTLVAAYQRCPPNLGELEKILN
jgi:hypothetical protein